MRRILLIAIAILLASGGALLAQEGSDGPIYFEEEFDYGIPEDWPNTGPWLQGDSFVYTVSNGNTVAIPGQWLDFSLVMRLRNSGPGVRSVIFRANPELAYTVDFRPEGVGLHRRAENRVTTWLDWAPGANDEDWQELVIISEGRDILILLNGELLFDYEVSLEEVQELGAAGFRNLGEGQFDVAYLALAPVILSPDIVAAKWSSSAGTQLISKDPITPVSATAVPASSIEFTLNGEELSQFLSPGGCVVLRWRVTGARAIYLQDELTTESGSFQSCPRETTLYLLRVVNFDGKVVERGFRAFLPDPTPTVVPTATPVPTSTIEFTLNGNTNSLWINPGSCVTLRWSVTNARAVYFQDERTAERGNWLACIRESRSYELRVQNYDGTSVTRGLYVFVTEPTATRIVPTATERPQECLLTPISLNMNLREGDNVEYPIVGRLNYGEYAQLIGRNLADTWYRVYYQGLNAWIAGRDYTRVQGDCDYILLRIYAPPEPPPTPIPTTPPRENPSLLVNGRSAAVIRRGECVTVSWYADGIRALYLEGRGVTGPTGESIECPTASRSYKLYVIFQDGRSRDIYVNVYVNN